MAEEQIIRFPQLRASHKIINVTITTNDQLTAMVLESARAVKRLNAILGLMLEAYLATPEGQVLAAQQLRMPVEDLLASINTTKPAAPIPVVAQTSEKPEAASTPSALSAPLRSGLNFDKLCS